MSDNHAPLTRAADTCEIDGTVFASFWNPRAHTVTDKEVAEAYVWIKDNSTFTENELATAGHYLETLSKALSRPKHTPIQAKMLRHALMSARCSFHTDEERDAINALLEGL